MNKFDVEFWNGVLKGLALAQKELSEVELHHGCKYQDECRKKVLDTVVLIKGNTERIHIANLRKLLEEASVID